MRVFKEISKVIFGIRNIKRPSKILSVFFLTYIRVNMVEIFFSNRLHHLGVVIKEPKEVAIDVKNVLLRHMDSIEPRKNKLFVFYYLVSSSRCALQHANLLKLAFLFIFTSDLKLL